MEAECSCVEAAWVRRGGCVKRASWLSAAAWGRCEGGLGAAWGRREGGVEAALGRRGGCLGAAWG